MSKQRLWILWFVILIIIIYTPLSQAFNLSVFGMPVLLTNWIILTFVCLASVIVFVLHTWREWN